MFWGGLILRLVFLGIPFEFCCYFYRSMLPTWMFMHDISSDTPRLTPHIVAFWLGSLKQTAHFSNMKHAYLLILKFLQGQCGHSYKGLKQWEIDRYQVFEGIGERDKACSIKIASNFLFMKEHGFSFA